MAIDKTGSTENIDSYKRVREPLLLYTIAKNNIDE